MGDAKSTHGGTLVLSLLALLSGCCALAYEVLYVRALTTLLGDMLYVHAALLSTFLVGIGAGAKLAHRGHRWLWAFEIGTGVYAVALPVITGWLSEQAIMVPVTSRPSLTIVATVVFLSLPSLLIGFSIPLFSAYIKARARDRLAFQSVYVLYNLGAMLSILLVELVLVRWLGIRASLAFIGAINVLNGLILLVIQGVPERPSREAPLEFPRRIIVALALASFASALFQMFFLKLTYLVFSPHRENFAVGLTITLLGIFLGAWLASRIPIRFATVVAAVPLALGLIYALYRPLLSLNDLTAQWAESSGLAILAHKLAIGSLFALLPMILFGATLPALMRHEREVAGESGHLLWISSLANAGGYLAYVVIVHPLLPGQGLLLLVGGLSLLAAMIALGWRPGRLIAGLSTTGAVALLVCTLLWQDRYLYLAQWHADIEPEHEVTVFKSGAESATLLRGPSFEWVSYNGHPSIFVQRHGVITMPEMLSGVIPALNAPTLDRALILGLGTGITAGAAGRIFDQVDVVEINDAFYKMMPVLAHANLDIAANSRVDKHLADGRSFLVGKDGLYDAIVNSIPAPSYYSASKIYTVEFYDKVARALKPDGVFCTWLAVPNMSQAGVETVLAAMRLQFDRCDLALVDSGYYMATCSNAPIQPRAFDELPVDPMLREELHRSLKGFELEEFFRDIRLSENIFDHFTPSVEQQNTDDHPILEFMIARSHELGRLGRDPFLGEQHEMNIDPVRRHEEPDHERLARRAGAYYRVDERFFRKNFLPLLRVDPQAWEAWLDVRDAVR